MITLDNARHMALEFIFEHSDHEQLKELVKEQQRLITEMEIADAKSRVSDAGQGL